MATAFDQRDDVLDFVKLAAGADSDQVQARLVKAMDRDFPVIEVRNQQELKENQEEQINQLLGLIYALLALAVIVSLFGIANTLALSIHERTRELGMLRAIGMSRRQVRTMIRYEAVITALIGALLGMVIGVIFAALIAQPLEDEGFALSYPVGTLLLHARLCGAGRRHRGDRPGTAGVAPRRAAGAPVRVANGDFRPDRRCLGDPDRDLVAPGQADALRLPRALRRHLHARASPTRAPG